MSSEEPKSPIAKLREVFTQFPYILRTLNLVWDAAHRLTFIWALLLIIQGLLPAALVYLTKILVDSLTHAIGTGFSWENIRPIVFLGFLYASVLLLTELVQGVLEWIRANQSELINDHITALIHKKSSEVDLAFYESPEYYDHLHRARSDASTRSLALLESSGSLIQNSITLIAMAAILIPYGVWLPALLFIGTLPALYIVFRYNDRYHRWWKRTTTDRRWAQYFDLLLTNNAVAAELRLFSLSSYFRSAYQKLRTRLRGERLTLIRDQSLSKIVASAFSLLITGLAVVWVLWRAVQGFFTIGDLALFYQAYTQGQGLMRSLLGNVGNIYSNSLFLSNLFEFLELNLAVKEPQNPKLVPSILQDGIGFQKVTFRYPGSERAVLENFDIFFPAGKVIAIVGPNGAGKSTLVKLLCRFYDPESGEIELDGVDIREISVGELRRQITVMFQTPVPYYATAAQNIAMGDLSIQPDDGDIETAARAAGAHDIIVDLPNGYATFLGKLFAGGVELSVGEWQRIALARAFLRRSQIVVLDEPTSSMDPWAEADWMERFRTLVDGRTSIIITHRFTTAKYADIIYVMKGGKIVESGNHDELLAHGQLYAQSWITQTRVNSLLSRETHRGNGSFPSENI